MISKFDKKDLSAVSLFKGFNRTEEQEDKMFYLNRFFIKCLNGVEYAESDDDCEAWQRLFIKSWTKALSDIKASGSMYD